MGDLSSFDAVLETAVASAIASIRNLSYEQLNEMLNDDSKINSLVDTVPQVSFLPEQRDLCSAQNKSLSEYNLSQEPQLEAAKMKLLKTYEETKKLKEEVTELKQKLDSLSEQRSLDTLSAVLQASAQSADDESDAIVEQYLGSEIEVEPFLDKFIEKKTLAHMRKIKSEKLLALLRQQRYPAMKTSMSHSKGYKGMSTSCSAGTPYPSQYTGGYPQPPMPQPRHSFY
ncbi:unnamed protein product [Enterobius vermicularis]|uniref:VPS37 C-terminal domain-containing protein n=1 Tax=Enterobius vermicularis TaxID=51028 RepID=A0A0N4VGQ6_ENTVE|nr:unnamed protein product [Enterobius vermicularis]